MGLEDSGVPHEFIDLQYEEHVDLKAAILKVCDQAEAAVRAGKVVLLLSDRYPVKGTIPIQALLATGAVHHRLVRTGLRCKCNILVETGTARDPHHFACLIGYGATAVYPYLAYQTLFDLMRKGAVKMDADQRLRTRPQLPARHPQGPVQDHVQDGNLHHRELPQLAAVRDRRPGRRGGVAVLRRLGEPHSRRGLRRFAGGSAVPGAARMGPGARPWNRAACSSICTAASTICTTRT